MFPAAPESSGFVSITYPDFVYPIYESFLLFLTWPSYPQGWIVQISPTFQGLNPRVCRHATTTTYYSYFSPPTKLPYPFYCRSLTDLTWLTEVRAKWFPLLPALDSSSKDWMEYYRYGATTREVKEAAATLIYPGDIPTAIFPRLNRVNKEGLIYEAYRSPYEEERKDRPPFAYTHLIIMAINASPEKKIALREIYAWIEQHFKYYRETHLVNSVVMKVLLARTNCH